MSNILETKTVKAWGLEHAETGALLHKAMPTKLDIEYIQSWLMQPREWKICRVEIRKITK